MSGYLDQLNESQREAVLYNEGPSLVIAGAGSGKTRVLTYKIAYLLDSGIPAYNILALTFTNKAAKEMKSRISLLVGEEISRRLWMGTFHSVFSRILRRESGYIGFDSNFTVYDQQDSRNLIKGIIKEKGLDDKIYKPASVQARISNAKNALITPSDYEKDRDLIAADNHAKRGQLHEIYTEYWVRCFRSGVMDFDDLLLYTFLLFRKHPDVLERYRNQFRFVLVDEYQDTNAVQHEIVSQLAADHHRVCVVGDDAQSIYSFRGADIGNILNFRKTYPEARLFKLEQNYRSTQTIVNAANSLIKKNTEQIPKTVFSEKQEGEKLQVVSAYSDYEEGYNVASRIAELRMLYQYDYRDFAILYRTNAQSRIFEEALRKVNIPYRIYGGLSFYQRKEVKDVIAYMRLIVNPSDEESLKRVINYPTRGIGSTTVGKIIEAASASGVSLWSVLSSPQEYGLKINSGTAAKLAGFRDLIDDFIRRAQEEDACQVGSDIVRATGLMGDLYADKTPEGLSRVQNVEELSNSLYEFVSSRKEEGNPEIGVGHFLAEIALLTDQDTDKDENSNRVTMMTIHSAKGLEFKNVFVIGLEEELFPSSRSRDSFRELEEERRLFYVAITRAEEHCILTHAKSRFRHGQSIVCSPSRFLKDIDSEYLNRPGGTMSTLRSQAENTPVRESYTAPRRLTRIETKPHDDSGQQRLGDLQVGDTIQHERFGLGKVTALSGNEENAKATVSFDSFGVKQLLLKFARFEILRQ